MDLTSSQVPNLASSTAPMNQSYPRHSFQELFDAQRALGADLTTAWQKATELYWIQPGDHAISTCLINASAEIPLPQYIGHTYQTAPEGVPDNRQTDPPINAAGLNHILSKTKPNDPVAEEFMKRNTTLLVESKIVEKLGQDSAPSSECSDITMTDEMAPVDRAEYEKFCVFEEEEEEEDLIPIDFAPTQAAHRLFWTAMGESTDDINL